MSGAARGIPDWLRWLGGPIAWSAQFLTVYASESLLCRAGMPSAHLALGVAVSLAAAGVAILSATAGRDGEGSEGHAFMGLLGVALGFLSLVAIAWTALPLAALPACAV